MGFLRDIAQFVWRGLNAVSSSVLMIGTLIVGAVTGFCSFIYGIISNAFGVIPYLYGIMENFEAHIDVFREYLMSNSYWHFFYDMFALDVFAEGLSYFLTLFGVALFLSLFGFFFAALSAITPFLIIRMMRSGVRICTGGIVNP